MMIFKGEPKERPVESQKNSSVTRFFIQEYSLSLKNMPMVIPLCSQIPEKIKIKKGKLSVNFYSIFIRDLDYVQKIDQKEHKLSLQ